MERRVRSFVRREGRITEAQRRALQTLWPRFGIEEKGEIDLDRLFGRKGVTVLEIGFGGGEALLQMARDHPEWNFLGIEVYRPGIGKLLRALATERIGNVRLLIGDAAEILPQNFPDGVLDRIHLFFPDPWPKKRHHKRRLVQPPFVETVARKLKMGGLFHLATDWPDYAEQIEQVVEASGRFLSVPPPPRPKTKYQLRAERLGHPIFDLAYRLSF